MEIFRRLENGAADFIGRNIKNEQQRMKVMAGIMNTVAFLENASKWIPQIRNSEGWVNLLASAGQALAASPIYAEMQNIPDVPGIIQQQHDQCLAFLDPNSTPDTLIFTGLQPDNIEVWNLHQEGNDPSENLHANRDPETDSVTFDNMKENNGSFKLSCDLDYKGTSIIDVNDVWGRLLGPAGRDNWHGLRKFELQPDKDGNSQTLEGLVTTTDQYTVLQGNNDPNNQIIQRGNPETGEIAFSLGSETNTFKIDSVTERVDFNNYWGPALGDAGTDGWFNKRVAAILEDQDNNPNTLEVESRTKDPLTLLQEGNDPSEYLTRDPDPETGIVVYPMKPGNKAVKPEVAESSSRSPWWKVIPGSDGWYQRFFPNFLPEARR